MFIGLIMITDAFSYNNGTLKGINRLYLYCRFLIPPLHNKYCHKFILSAAYIYCTGPNHFCFRRSKSITLFSRLKP